MDQFENMQKLAFGKVITEAEPKKGTLTEATLKGKISELIKGSLDEAKKKKKKAKDVAPQTDADIDIQIPSEDTEEVPTDMDVPEEVPTAGGAEDIGGEEEITDIDPNVKKIQDSLQKAYVISKQLGDKKLMAQIGNTITMLVRTQVLGAQQNMNEDAQTDAARHSRYTTGKEGTSQSWKGMLIQYVEENISTDEKELSQVIKALEAATEHFKKERGGEHDPDFHY